MADLVAVQSGNIGDATTWALVDPTSKLISTSTLNTTVNTTGTQETPSFTPGAITVQGFCLRLVQTQGNPATNILTLSLRNFTASTTIASVTLNISLLPYCTAGQESEGGWFFAKFSAPVTLIAATAYRIRLVVNNQTSAFVTLGNNGTANNFQRMLVTTTNQVPAAGDDLHVMGAYVGTVNPVTTITPTVVTVNTTTAVDYGTAQTNTYVSAMSVSKGGTLQFSTASAVSTVMRLSGHLKVYRDGLLNMGSVATPMPRDSVAALEFDCAVDLDFGLRAMDGSNVILQGQSRTSGKNISLTLLTVDAAAAVTSLTVANDTGWLSGDQIGLASTGFGPAGIEEATLTASAGASTLTTTALAVAHMGDVATERQAEVLLLTRNVIVRSVSTTAMSYVRFIGISNPPIAGLPVFDCDWVQFRYVGFGGVTAGGITIDMSDPDTEISFDHCIVWNTESCGWATPATPLCQADIFLRNCSVYGTLNTAALGTGGGGIYAILRQGSTCIIDDFTYISGRQGGATPATQFYGIQITPTRDMMIRRLRASSGSAGLVIILETAFHENDVVPVEWGPMNLHNHGGGTGGGGGIIFNASGIGGMKFKDIHCWRNITAGVIFSKGNSVFDIHFTGTTILTGNSVAGMQFNNVGTHVVTVHDVLVGSEVGSTQGNGFDALSANIELSIIRVDEGSVISPYTNNTGYTFNFQGSYGVESRMQAVIRNSKNCDFFRNFNNNYTIDSFLSLHALDRVPEYHVTETPLGDVVNSNYWGSTDFLSLPGIILSPHVGSWWAGNRLESGGMRPLRGFTVPVLIGQTATVAVAVYKDGYTGSQPRLILKNNLSLGIPNDVVIDTMTVGDITWETLTGTSPAVTDNGVLEFVVDCDGNEGYVHVNQWNTGSTPAGNEAVWYDGLPFKSGATPSSGGTGGTRGYAFVG